jgi:hypothetical protein
MTSDETRLALERNGVNGAAVNQLLDLAAQCDAARFSPGMATCTPADTLELARQVLEKL